MMTEQEAYAAGYHASREGIKHQDVWMEGPDGPVKETQGYLPRMPFEIRDDEMLSAAWFRGFDEGKRAQFDQAFPPENDLK